MLQRILQRFLPLTRQCRCAATFSTHSILSEKALPPRPKILETDLEEKFLKGTGPGGQKINKTSSAVQLRHIPTGIVVKSQETRSRHSNRKHARDILAEKLDFMEKGDQSRTVIKADRAKKKKASADKKARRKYKKLAEEKEGKESEENEDEDVEAISDEATKAPTEESTTSHEKHAPKS